MFVIFKKFFAFAGKQRGKWYKGIGFAILHSVFEAFQLLAMAVAIRAIVENNMNSQTVWLTLGIMLVSVIGMMITRHISDQSEIIGSYKMCEEKRIQIGDRMKYMPMGYFNSHSLGKITAAATTTMEEIEKISPPALSKTMLGLIRTLIITIGLIIFDWRIGLITLAGVVLFFLINAVLQHKSRMLSPERQKAQAKVVETVLEYIQGMSVVRAFKLDQDANKAMNRAIAEVEKRNFDMEFSLTPYVALQQLVLRL
ncbi:MAG: ABC transporter ATP-binding protein, partial [Firmicutes bacterium]|nr:ABC transporter ATP-binding protein [Bacillota bacterium]